MAEQITIPAEKVWNYFNSNKAVLRQNMHRIAENKDYGTEVYLTSENDYPSIVVYADDTEVFSTLVLDEEQCCEEVNNVYGKYLTENFIETVYDSYDYYDERDYADINTEDIRQETDIDERESDLDWAFSSLLETVLDNCGAKLPNDITEISEDVKEHTLEYLARKYNIAIYRPMFIRYEDGKGGFEEEFEEYPYDKLEFDDEE